MMEILLVLAVLLTLVLILGNSVLPIMVIVLGLMILFTVLCAVFFAVMAVIVAFTKPKRAKFIELAKNERGIPFALYEIDGKECQNTFPTDAILQKWLYNKRDVVVCFLNVGDVRLVFDKVTLAIIGIGLPVFCGIAYALIMFIRMV